VDDCLSGWQSHKSRSYEELLRMHLGVSKTSWPDAPFISARKMSHFTRRALLLVLLILHLGAAAQSPIAENSLKIFLQRALRRPGLKDDKTTKYSVAFVDLNDAGKNEAIVYLTGQSWCGSGGCVALILSSEGFSYKIVTKITVARTPIRVLKATSKGWHNLGIWVQGGGIQRGYEAELRFDGKAYPSNPTVLPARRSAAWAPGEVAVPSNPMGKPLYP
jgi:hypothetical protein